MKIRIAWVGKTKESAIAALTEEYLKRISRFCDVDGITVRDEADLLAKVSGAKVNPKPTVVLMDLRGKELTSEEFARFLQHHQDRNPLPLVFAIGGADGFSKDTRVAARYTISLGRMTLPHELARVVLLEQIYRAFTILKGHPYHSGH